MATIAKVMEMMTDFTAFRNSEAHRAECMSRLICVVNTLLLQQPNSADYKKTLKAYAQKHGVNAAREARNVERAVREGKLKLDRFK